MNKASRLVVPLFVAAMAIGLAMLQLPLGAAARDEGPTTTEVIEPSPVLFGGETEDVQLSLVGGNLPEVAANGDFVALAYERNNLIFLRTAKAPVGSSLGWTSPPTPVGGGTQGNAPKLDFSPVGTDTLHVVWTGANQFGLEKVMRHAKCTLTETSIGCSAPEDIASLGAGQDNIKQPDVTVDENGRIHTAWFDESGGGVVRTALSQTAASNWSETSVPIDGDESNAGQVALASNTGLVHLAFRDFDDGAPAINQWRIKYFRAVNSTQSWGDNETFEEVSNHAEVRNPTIAATSGNKVQLAWDTVNASNGQLYGLIGASSADNGLNWATTDITSTSTVDAANAPESKASQDSTGIPVNRALRPSLAVNSGNFDVVWQMLPHIPCNPFGAPFGPHPSQIYYASNTGNSWATNDKLSDVNSTYKVDPDLAVDSNGTHIVFMKVTDDGDCSGGTSTDYTIYYRGPFTNVQIPTDSYLPLILKRR